MALPIISSAQAPAGRGAAPTAKPAPPPAGPPPRLPNGQINLGAIPGQKGFWNSFNGQIIGKTGNALPTNLTIEEVPLRPWARALYDTATSAMVWTIRTRGASLPGAFAS